MKTCRKCKKEYKDDYIYCPKCGTPYDSNKKAVKTPSNIVNPTLNIISKIWNIILYIIGGLIILAYLTSFSENPADSIFAILFGLSLFQIFYKLLSDKANSVDVDKFLKIARIVLPIAILIMWMIAVPVKDTDKEKTNSDLNAKKEEKIEKNEGESEPIESKDDANEEKQNIEETKQEEVSYTLGYKLLGDYGKLVEYEGEKEYFYYFPSGNYDIELTRMTGNVCFLWIDYNKGYKGDHGTSYNNKEKLSFTKKGEKKNISLTDDVHIYNSNDCSYKLTKKN